MCWSCKFDLFNTLRGQQSKREYMQWSSNFMQITNIFTHLHPSPATNANSLTSVLSPVPSELPSHPPVLPLPHPVWAPRSAPRCPPWMGAGLCAQGAGPERHRWAPGEDLIGGSHQSGTAKAESVTRRGKITDFKPSFALWMKAHRCHYGQMLAIMTWI